MKKPPRRTAERILATALTLFNRYGEPNVATTLIASDMGISPGNLFYHYPSKDMLVNRLFDQFTEAMQALLPAAADAQDIEHAWFFLHSWFELIWQYRFLYRDLNDLLSKNRHLESQVKVLISQQRKALEALLSGLQRHGLLQLHDADRARCATHMVVMLTWWLSYEYVQDPRHAMEDETAHGAALRGAQHVLALLLPFLGERPRTQLASLMQAYA